MRVTASVTERLLCARSTLLNTLYVLTHLILFQHVCSNSCPLNCRCYSNISSSVAHFSCLTYIGFPGGTSCKEPTSLCRRHKKCGFDPWVGKISWRRSWQPTPVFLPGKSHGQRWLVGYSP